MARILLRFEEKSQEMKFNILIGLLAVLALALAVYNYVDIMAMPITRPMIKSQVPVSLQDTYNPQTTINATELQGGYHG